MTDRDISDSWSPARAKKPDQNTRLSRTPEVGTTQPSGVPATGSNFKSVTQQQENDTEGLPIKNHLEKTFNLSKITERMPSWMKSWVLWSILLTLIPSGVGFISMSMLLKLPSAPNCPKIFWPLASASVRLHCASLAASKQTLNDLLQAIALVKELPPNHPLRGQINSFLEEWSRDILQLADQSFQSGNLEEAIATARQVPEDLEARKIVEEQITKWQSIWSKAEAIYDESIKELGQRHWQSAFMLSSKLLRINNQYWATTKYDELNRIIVTAREDGDKLYKAEGLADSRSVDKVLEAIKLAESIKSDSYLYQKAQELIPVFGRKILKLAQAKMDQRDADTALEIVRQIPPIAELQAEIDDFVVLGEAQRSAWIGTVSGLEAAISQAQQIDASREVYEKAQELITRWQLEIQDVSRLEKARSLASQGTINELTAAISEAQMIPDSNPRADEARQEMNRWRGQVESIEDRPYLERADQIALLEDINSLQSAIAEASQIRSGRALYPEARRKIRTWTAKIQRIQDQPYLDQARIIADSGDLNTAIREAQKIASSGRALASEAQIAVDTWQEQIRAKENWRKAREVAITGTPEALAEAIRLADRVSNRNVLRMDANVAIDQWSQQLLQMARSQSEFDVAKSIETARLIPRGSSAYRDAQQQIRTWKQFLMPRTLPTPSAEPSPEAEQSPVSTSDGL
ncbi:chromosome segregation ATPase [Sphaerospermopsis aphanizomenoides BCCUSP55]|uniref:chromosome segregation ATPase n=1 Tax=Sphaerospermopsis aphanizomenoides TaxID=459663 RepID=UPI000AACB8F7|nr:chromosome segregation ATPase [Sphaerospermopsis aphanizomenoides]MBK1990317.1 chromosome segregation ATPase [Sphaerospermopsis aphanizomenoides BCCUSP55]